MSSPSSSNETSCNKLSIKYILNPIDESTNDKKIKFLFTSESYKTPSRKNKYRTAPGRGHRSWISWVVPPVPEAAAAKGAAAAKEAAAKGAQTMLSQNKENDLPDEYGNYYINGVYII